MGLIQLTIATFFVSTSLVSIMTLAWRYNADRMVTDYVRHAYLPAAGGLCSE